jgi:pimeloyl-ACP methyl ester carboxylesterase
MTNRHVVLNSGRTVGISGAGDPLARRLVILCHPTPGAGSFDPDPTTTNSWGVRLLTVDRPGYGSSEPIRADGAATVENRADDLAEYVRRSEHNADRLSHPEFRGIGVVGWGLGGSVALSLAARHPDLIDRVAVVGTRLPVRAMPSTASPSQPMPLRVQARLTVADVMADLSHRGAMALDWLGIADDDPALAGPGVRNRLERMLADASVQGVAGVATDLVAAEDVAWSRELGQIRASTILVYGESDPMVKRTDGRWFRRHVPNSKLVVVKNAGRLAIVSTWKQILEHVAPRTEHA